MAALARGDGIAAEADLRAELAKGAPRNQIAPFMGEAQLMQGNLADAHRWLDNEDFAPNVRGQGFRIRGHLAMREGKLGQAEKAYATALQFEPDSADLWVDIGRMRYRSGAQFGAVEASKKAITLGPENPSALLFRAQLVRDSQGMAAALPLFELGLKHSPNNAPLLAGYAATLGELGRAKEMLAALRKLANTNPGNPRLLYLQAVLAARAGDYDLARGLLQRSGDLERQMPAAILLLGIIDLENGNYASAAQGFDRLARLQPENARVQRLLARALKLGGSDRELIARFAGRADTPYIAMLVGRAYEAIGDREKAAGFLNRAQRPFAMTVRDLAPATDLDVAELYGDASGPSTVSLVRGLVAAGNPTQAKARADAFLARYPQSSDAMALDGDASLAMGRPDLATQIYNRAAAVRRPWPLAKRMIYALIEQGREVDAANLLARFVKGEPNNAEACALLARWAYLQGDYTRATMLLDHASLYGAANDPTLVSLRAAIARKAGE
ncbi:tetratricopeptide repeat protein [Tsuneonella mangrovi]|uniref:tetratricopeptide repeat protein n=1 Tax=Tsuneonella mangrovi TaxID=1982042 RepID=UPI001470D4AE|nr:tetratricopeptide repeat protein [Tsuneonella mangrovi]